jgi:hypothetical protein
MAVRHIDRVFLLFCILVVLACAVLMATLNGQLTLILTGAAAGAACCAGFLLRLPLTSLHKKLLVRRAFASNRMSQAHAYISDTVNRMELALADSNLPVFESMLQENQGLRGLDAVVFLEALYALIKGDTAAAFRISRETVLAGKGHMRYIELLNSLAAAGVKPDEKLAQALRAFAPQMDLPQFAPLLCAIVDAEYNSPAADLYILDLAIKYTDNMWYKLKRFYSLASLGDAPSLNVAYGLGMHLYEAFRDDKVFVEALVSVIKRTGALDASSSAVVNHYYSTFFNAEVSHE